MAEQMTITDEIRGVLRAADDSLTLPQVKSALEKLGRPTCSVKALLRQRSRAGEFIQAEINSQVRYTLNPEFELRRKLTPRVTVADIVEALEDGPLTTVELIAATGNTLTAGPFSKRLLALSRKGQLHQEIQGGTAYWSLPGTSSTPDAAAAPAASPCAAMPAPEPLRDAGTVAASGTPTPAAFAYLPQAPHGLAERLDAIVQDIEDALVDACTAELPHALIRHLVTASNAAGRAARNLER